MKDYYKILGVTKQTPEAELKKKYRELAKKYHPDKHKGDANAEARFKDISEAYDVLSHPDKRQKYDMERENPFSSFGGGGFGGAGRGAQGQNFEDFGDIFSSFFGGGSRGGKQRKRSSEKQRPIEEHIRIPFHLALKGGEYLHRSANGKTVKLKIPSNCADGHKLKLGKFGDHGEDLIITIGIVLPETITLDGLNVIQKVKIPIWDGILGGKQEVRLYNDQKVNVTIKPGSDSHTRLKLPNFGLQKDHASGDCYLELVFESPKNLTDQQITLLQSLKYNT